MYGSRFLFRRAISSRRSRRGAKQRLTWQQALPMLSVCALISTLVLLLAGDWILVLIVWGTIFGIVVCQRV